MGSSKEQSKGALPDPATAQAPAAHPASDRLSGREEAYLKAAKEIAVKFIETGRIGVASFGESFTQIYRAVKDSVEK